MMVMSVGKKIWMICVVKGLLNNVFVGGVLIVIGW